MRRKVAGNPTVRNPAKQYPRPTLLGARIRDSLRYINGRRFVGCSLYLQSACQRFERYSVRFLFTVPGAELSYSFLCVVRQTVVWACVGLVLSACSLAPKLEPKEAPPAPTFEALMAGATKARQEGSVSKERDTYRAAAAAHPTRKEPWSKLAESYFEARDYGNSILAAQEVLQRDASDSVATSMLAVSGLRVSTAALSSLRNQKSLNSDTRAQAEDIVKSLREVLGENVLVPAPAAVPVAAPAAPQARRPAPRPPSAATAGAAVAPAATTAAPAAPAAAASAPRPGNPFQRLR
ncbi:MAG: hypothetical protein LH480_09490 [Rubrivivax sp.]|nr:hypothetical protein [Rubrivivax sp.]